MGILGPGVGASMEELVQGHLPPRVASPPPAPSPTGEEPVAMLADLLREAEKVGKEE